MHLAARAGRLDAVELLLNHGANPTLPCSKNKKTPLEYARINSLRKPCPDVLRLLESSAASIAAADDGDAGGNGSPPLDVVDGLRQRRGNKSTDNETSPVR